MNKNIRTRSVPTELELSSDRRTLELLAVPWDKPARVIDMEPDVRVYMEGFRRSAFDNQVNGAPGVVQRISFRDRHNDNGIGKLGQTVALRVLDEGLHAVVKLLRSRVQDVEDMVEDGIERLSVEFFPMRGGTEIDGHGVRWRTRAHLDAIALEPQGAYEEARILAMREAVSPEEEELQAEAELRRRSEEVGRWLEAERDRYAHLRSENAT